MNSYESFDQNIETFTETGDSSEYVWGTEIQGFEASGVTSNEQVADFVRNEIPLSHLDRVSDISPVNTQQYEQVGNNFIALTNHEINGQVAAHIGREVYYSNEISGETFQDFIALPTLDEVYDAKGCFEHSGDLETKTLLPSENFAHVYATYIESPNLLKSMAPEHYNFMRDNVFYGREYTGQDFIALP